MPAANEEGEIPTLEEAAEYLKVTERTIYRLAAAKRIAAFKVGGTWLFSRGDPPVDQAPVQRSIRRPEGKAG